MSFEDLRAITARWLKAALEGSELSTDEVSKKSGVARSTIYRLLGEESNADEATIEALEDVLQRPFPRLMVGGGSDSPIRRDRQRARIASEPRSIYRAGNEPSEETDEDTAYLAYTLETLRALGVAERDEASVGVKLLMLEQAEEIGLERFGERPKAFIEHLRERIRRGQPLGPAGAQSGD